MGDGDRRVRLTASWLHADKQAAQFWVGDGIARGARFQGATPLSESVLRMG